VALRCCRVVLPDGDYLRTKLVTDIARFGLPIVRLSCSASFEIAVNCNQV